MHQIRPASWLHWYGLNSPATQVKQIFAGGLLPRLSRQVYCGICAPLTQTQTSKSWHVANAVKIMILAVVLMLCALDWLGVRDAGYQSLCSKVAVIRHGDKMKCRVAPICVPDLVHLCAPFSVISRLGGAQCCLVSCPSSACLLLLEALGGKVWLGLRHAGLVTEFQCFSRFPSYIYDTE